MRTKLSAFRRNPGPIVVQVRVSLNPSCGEMGPGFRRYRIHTSLVRHVSAKRRPYTSRPRSGEREGPIAKQWEGEGRPCYFFLRRAAQPDCRHFHEPFCNKGPGAPHPPNADALGPSLSPLSPGEVYRR